MKFPAVDVSDVVTGVLLVALAGLCLGFAGYMVLRLSGMENPPADMGLYIPEAMRRGAANAVLVDPLTTGTIDGAARRPDGAAAVQPFTLRDRPVLGHRLVAVFDGLAFVELTRLDGKDIVTVRVGSDLAGAGRVRRIERSAAGWRVVTEALTIGGDQ